jgi:DNA-binding beta-propeller fold protein YncE
MARRCGRCSAATNGYLEAVRRRHLLSRVAPVAIAALAVAGGFQGVAQAKVESRPILAVGNSYDGTVNLIDARTLHRLGPPLNVIPDGDTPRDPAQASIYDAIISSRGEENFAQEVAFSPDAKTLYVSRGYLGDVAAFSLTTRELLWRVQLPSLRADHLAVSPDGQNLFVTSLPGTKVLEVSTSTHQVVGSYDAGDYPHVLEFSPDEKYLYSGSLGNQLAPYGLDNGVHEIAVADPTTLQVVRTYQFDAGVRPFEFTTDGRRLVLQLSYFNGFKVLDLASGNIVRSVELPLRGPGTTLSPKDYPNAAAHHGIAISGNTVCDAGTISNYAALVSLKTGHVNKIVDVGQAPGEALTSLDGRYCYLTNRGPTALSRPRVTDGSGDSVSVVDYRTGHVRTVKVGVHPQSEATARVSDKTLRAGGFLTH